MRDGTSTRRRIEEEALRLFARKGVNATSIRDIAEASGVSEGALYRHTRSKDELARRIFDEAYAALAQEVLKAERGARFDVAVRAIVAVFCRLFDSNRSLFAFLLLAQHGYLSTIPADANCNVVEAVKLRIAEAIARGDLPRGNPEEITAFSLGIVAQPAIFTLYGRLSGPLSARVESIADAVLAVAAKPAS